MTLLPHRVLRCVMLPPPRRAAPDDRRTHRVRDHSPQVHGTGASIAGEHGAGIGDPPGEAQLDTLLGWPVMYVERSRGGVFA